MCGIFGIVNYNAKLVYNMCEILGAVRNRGRDGTGIVLFRDKFKQPTVIKNFDKSGNFVDVVDYNKLNDSWYDILMCTMRAQPTSNSEWLHDPEPWMIQPYVTMYPRVSGAPKGYVCVSHNGTFANDTKFNKKFSVFDCDNQDKTFDIDSSILLNYNSSSIQQALEEEIVGSYAVAMVDTTSQEVILAKNYMPLKILIDFENKRIAWASEEKPLLLVARQSSEYRIIDMPAYSSVRIYTYDFTSSVAHLNHIRERVEPAKKVLVVCSGGLDSSTVASHYVKELGPDNVELLHYHYGCKAEAAEQVAVDKIGKRLGVNVNYMDISGIFKNYLSSPLTDDSIKITEGDEGIEYAKEWVPARNLILMSMAIGLAEKKGFSVVAIGANLTEQAAYPDNSLDFIEKLNAVAKYSVQNGVNITVEAPFVNLMKQEIVKYAIEINAPLDLMVSCYQPVGDVQCGTCGPCVMRKLAFRMNGLEDTYKTYKDPS